jgi:BirA family biotin operon repressor/biotin-[acetyl-CoA-carboxylase] ligase
MPFSTETISGWTVERFDDIDSTSLLARRLVMEESHRCTRPHLLIARRQSAGRGRLGRPWCSPEGGLWGTFIWPVPHLTPAPRAPLADHQWSLEGLGLRIGVACARAIEDIIDLASRESADPSRRPETALKWPNDVLVAGKKVLGVLTEAIARSGSIWLVIGVGVNANFSADKLPAELRASATTLRDQLGREVDPDALLLAVSSRLRNALLSPRLDAVVLDGARSRLAGVGSTVAVAGTGGETIRGVLLGLNDSGRPIVRCPTSFLYAGDAVQIVV